MKKKTWRWATEKEINTLKIHKEKLSGDVVYINSLKELINTKKNDCNR